MKDVNQRMFFVMVTLLFLFIWIAYLEIIVENFLSSIQSVPFIQIGILLIGFVLIIWLAIRIQYMLTETAYEQRIFAIFNVVIFLFLSFQLLTTYFFTDEYLEQVSVDLIEMHYESINPTVTEERAEFLSEMSLSSYWLDHASDGTVEDPIYLRDIQVSEIDRNYSSYDVLANVYITTYTGEGPRSETEDFLVQVEWDLSGYRIRGMTRLDLN